MAVYEVSLKESRLLFYLVDPEDPPWATRRRGKCLYRLLRLASPGASCCSKVITPYVLKRKIELTCGSQCCNWYNSIALSKMSPFKDPKNF